MSTKRLKMDLVHLFLIVFIIESAIADDECNEPTELKLKREYCWTENVEMVDRLVQRSKGVLNFAKKKLGMEVEDENNEQKCEYYLCLLRQLHMLNANDYPAYESIQEWTKRNVIYNQAVGLLKQLEVCNGALTDSAIRQRSFYADQIVSQDHEVKYVEDNTPLKDQTTCEIAAEFINCLSKQNNKCPVFKFP